MNLSRLFETLKRRFAYGPTIDPTRDWVALLTLSIILLAAILVWNVWAFDTVAQGGTLGGAATSTAPVFSQNSLDAIHSIFKERAVEETKYLTGVYGFADPSQ